MKPNNVTDNILVSLDYTLSVDGEVVDTTVGAEPINFVQGQGQILPALERQLTGMTVGETRDIFIAANEGYGDYDPTMVTDVPRGQFPSDFVFVLGGQLRIQDSSGNTFNATIRGIGPEKIELDLNHPLAGKDLLFQARVVDLQDPNDTDAGGLGGGAGLAGL